MTELSENLIANCVTSYVIFKNAVNMCGSTGRAAWEKQIQSLNAVSIKWLVAQMS